MTNSPPRIAKRHLLDPTVAASFGDVGVSIRDISTSGARLRHDRPVEAGEKSVLPYKFVYCALIVVATMGFLKTDAQLDNLTGIGTGVMLFANIPIMLFFGSQAMRAYHNYVDRLRSGQMGPDHPKPSLEDLVSGRDLNTRK